MESEDTERGRYDLRERGYDDAIITETRWEMCDMSAVRLIILLGSDFRARKWFS